MNIKAALDIGTAAFAFVAAALWLRSAMIKTPVKITSGYGGGGGTAQELGDAIRRQSRWSAAAAFAAAIAAVLQAASAMLG